jgi:hypothetical protein
MDPHFMRDRPLTAGCVPVQVIVDPRRDLDWMNGPIRGVDVGCTRLAK